MPFHGLRIGVPGGAPFVAAGSGDISWVLPGAAVDMDFANNRYFANGALTTIDALMNAGLTSAIGPLLTALKSPACSILLYLKAAPTVPTSWILASGGTQGFLIRGLTDTTVTTRDNLATPFNLTATAGSGAFSTTACKICVMFDGTTGRSIVMNNGTVATDAQIVTSAPTAVAFANVAASFNRLTVFTSRLSNGAGAALTV